MGDRSERRAGERRSLSGLIQQTEVPMLKPRRRDGTPEPRFACGAGRHFRHQPRHPGVAWWTTTGMAYVAIRLGHVSQHKEWVLRSYVVTFTFVTTRALAELGILPSLGRDPFATLVWLSWSMPLLATEVIVQGRKVIARRGAV